MWVLERTSPVIRLIRTLKARHAAQAGRILLTLYFPGSSAPKLESENPASEEHNVNEETSGEGHDSTKRQENRSAEATRSAKLWQFSRPQAGRYPATSADEIMDRFRRHLLQTTRPRANHASLRTFYLLENRAPGPDQTGRCASSM
jgi:hypothetical protein